MTESSKKRIMLVVGARPNFMKAAPVLRALEAMPFFETQLVHTGQHYDENMSDQFFLDCGIRKPEVALGVGSGSHAQQTAQIMIGLEQEMIRSRPDLVLVVGDVNSTLAATLTAKKLGIRVGHVEAGLRSFDMTMPEEINRKVTDTLSDFLFVHEESGTRHLRDEGHPQERIYFVGNVMIDSLLYHLDQAQSSQIRARYGLEGVRYALVTLHRPSNVDTVEHLARMVEMLEAVAEKIRVVFPCHPRTLARLQEFGLEKRLHDVSRILVLPPLGYLDFLHLQAHANVVLTDSGGIQEETTALGIPCLTLRDTTERPITVEQGTNIVVGFDRSRILQEIETILTTGGKKGTRPPLWDGQAARRIVAILDRML